MHLEFSFSCEIKKSACIQPDLALHQTTSENKGVYSCQGPCMCQPPPKACAFCSPSVALRTARCLQLCWTQLRAAPAPAGSN